MTFGGHEVTPGRGFGPPGSLPEKSRMEINLSNLDAATRTTVDNIFRKDFDLKVLKAIERQTKAAARNHLHRPRAKDGFGERVCEIDPYIDALWRNAYGSQYSHDEELMQFLMKRNPEITVRSLGTRIQVGYAPVNTKFSKRYDWGGQAA